MKLIITFKQINDSFNQEYADQYDFGKESIDNQKYHWEHSFELVEEIDKISITKNQNIHYTGLDNGEKYNVILEKVTLFTCFKGDEIYSQYAVSDELLERIHEVYKEKSNTKYCYFYLKDREDYYNFEEHIYVLEVSVKQLRKQQ